MCRLAAYIGPAISLRRFLLEPPHSLVRQAWAPREMTDGTVSADGYGFGWFDTQGRPARFVDTRPIWSDRNLESLGRALSARAWVGNVRGATPGMDVSEANTQPFADARCLFLHNGRVCAFARLRRKIRAWLVPDLEGEIRGHTDSEHLFAVLRQLARSAPIEQALVQLCALVAGWLGQDEALLNLIVSDGRRLYVVRHAVGAACPSLYVGADVPGFPHGQLAASEPLTPSPRWQPVPPHHLVVLTPGEPAALVPL